MRAVAPFLGMTCPCILSKGIGVSPVNTLPARTIEMSFLSIAFSIISIVENFLGGSGTIVTKPIKKNATTGTRIKEVSANGERWH